MKHNYIALCTFRGWDIYTKEWAYGSLKINNDDNTCMIYDEDKALVIVEPESLGVYTGRDDEDEKPIFCAVNGAKFGSDEINFIDVNGYDTYLPVRFDGGRFYPFVAEYACNEDVKVTGNQWEQHLKDKV